MKHGGQHRQGRLGADGVVDLRGRVERDAEDLLHEAGRGFLEGRDAVVGVAAVFELVDLALERLARTSGSAMSSFSPMPKSSRRRSGWAASDGSLGPLDLLELVDLGALAVVGAADAVGEQGLEPGVGGGGHRSSSPNSPLKKGSDPRSPRFKGSDPFFNRRTYGQRNAVG